MNQLRTVIRNVVAVGVLVSLGLLSTPAEAQNVCVIRAAPPAQNCDSMGPAGTPFVRGVNCRGMRVDGFPREYIVYVPKNPHFGVEAPRPLVFMFHGTTGDAQKFLNISGWAQKAEQVGLIAVFPTALEAFVLDSGRCTTKWNKFNLPAIVDLTYKPRWVGPSGEVIDYPDDAPWPADDISFVRAMLDDVKSDLNVDAQRVFASGFSNGAAFTVRVAVELSDLFADSTFADAVSSTVAFFGLEPTRYDVRERPTHFSVNWRTTVPGNPDGNIFRFSLLGRVTHQYPRCFPNDCNNPDGRFTAVNQFWDFFTRHAW